MADPASNLLSDALMGKPVEQSGETPVVSDTTVESVGSVPSPSLDMSLPSVPPTTGSAEPSWESTPAPAVSEMPSTEISLPPSDSLQATPVPIEPGKPLEAVSPTGVPVAPPTVSSLPPAPVKKGVPPAAIAGLAVLAVVTIGVVTAVILSGQSQELRQQAYVAPPAPAAQVADPDEIFVAPSAQNSFTSNKNKYPNAASKPIATDGIRGTLFVADDTELQSRVFFAEMTGLQSSDSTVPVGWLVYGDGSFLPIGEVEIVPGNVGYVVSEQFEGLINATGFEVSYESSTREYEVTPDGQKPTQRVVHVDL